MLLCSLFIAVWAAIWRLFMVVFDVWLISVLHLFIGLLVYL